MRNLQKFTKYTYTSVNLAYLRSKYNLRICFKNTSLSFLHKQDTITKGLSNRIVIRSNYIRSYKQLRYFYTWLLRVNLTGYVNRNSSTYTFKSKDISYFLESYKRSLHAFNDLDRVLIWRASQINSIFKIIYKEKRKKKQYIYTSRLQFVPPHKRILIVWRWLNVLIRSYAIKDKKWQNALLPSLENFLTSHSSNNILVDLKLYVYKIKLLRTT